MVDDYIKIETNRLDYIRQQQSRLRAETLQGLYDHVNPPNHNANYNPANASVTPSLANQGNPSTPLNHPSPPPQPHPPSSPPQQNESNQPSIIDPPDSPLISSHVDDADQHNAGIPIILPSSFIGSPRNMSEKYHDSMAIVRELSVPDLFITFTCNEKWPEITNNLLPGQKPSDRPDLIARVFQMYHNELTKDITDRHVLGRCVSKINVIEFQKRGKPHSHILVHLDDADKIRSSADIDTLVSAEIPDPNLFPDLHEIVTSCMLHGPCGPVLNPKCVCMKNGECTKGFPKDFAPHTLFSDNGYPLYRRTDNGQVFMKDNKPLDNRWVIPYNAYLLLKYRCHINVEVCVSVKSVKYLFKYVYKGHDCASMRIVRDSIETFLQSRYVCPPEAAHRIFQFKMNHSTFSVDRLPVHLPHMQSVFFNPGQEDQALQEALQQDTKLTAWFSLNSSDGYALQFLYSEIPLHYCWVNNKWRRRKRNHKVVTRLYHVSPRDVERYHLRILLLNIPGAFSFEHLRTFNGVTYPTFQEACLARHLIHSDSVWEETIRDAALAGLPNQLRQMFAYMLLNCRISDPPSLWQQFRHLLAEDYTRNGLSQFDSEQKALSDISSVLKGSSKTLTTYRLPDVVTTPSSSSSSDPDTLTDDEVHEEMLLYSEMADTLTDQQREIIDAIIPLFSEDGVPSGPTAFFINGPGGSGKTYVYRFLIHWLRSFGKKVMASAMTGIAATLLPGGRTAHKTFTIPVPCHENGTCKVKPNSPYADQLRRTTLFIIDEATMLSKHQLKAIDRMLRDITGVDILFGGKVVLFGGDWRQTMPVLRKATDTMLIENCIISSDLWPQIKRFDLTSNMRANADEDEFKSFLLHMGDGKLPLKQANPYLSSIEIPHHFISTNDIVDSIYPEDEISQNPLNIIKRAILCPTNRDTFSINKRVLDRLPGETKVYASADTIDDCLDAEEAENYTIEFLNSLTPSGMPNHNLFLKEGVIVMLLRNLDTDKDLTNGIRLIIKRMYDLFLDAEILTGQGQGRRVLIPKMTLAPSDTDLPFRLCRVQFPLRLAYAMTINKSQGQTFDKLGIYLNRSCFSHGQLYVAFSRAKSHKDILVQIDETPEQGKHEGKTYTKNVVLREVLLS